MIILNPNVGWYARLKSYFRQKYPVKTKNLEGFWNSQSGDWHWLTEKPIPLASLNRNLWRASVPSLSICQIIKFQFDELPEPFDEIELILLSFRVLRELWSEDVPENKLQ